MSNSLNKQVKPNSILEVETKQTLIGTPIANGKTLNPNMQKLLNGLTDSLSQLYQRNGRRAVKSAVVSEANTHTPSIRI